MKGWYHNATDTGDAPEVRYFETEASWYDARVFTEGPFDTFGAAKADAIAFYRNMVAHYREAIHLAKQLRKPPSSPSR